MSSSKKSPHITALLNTIHRTVTTQSALSNAWCLAVPGLCKQWAAMWSQTLCPIFSPLGSSRKWVPLTPLSEISYFILYSGWEGECFELRILKRLETLSMWDSTGAGSGLARCRQTGFQVLPMSSSRWQLPPLCSTSMLVATNNTKIRPGRKLLLSLFPVSGAFFLPPVFCCLFVIC